MSLLLLCLLYSAVLSPMQLCHHLLCLTLNNFASALSIPLYSAVTSPSLLCLHPLYSAPTLLSPTLSALRLHYPTLFILVPLLCANLVLSCILTYPTLLLLILCNHLTWLATLYWCTQVQHRVLCMIRAQGKVRFLCQSMGKNIQRLRIGTL